MPYGYLAGTALLAWCTAFCLAPRRWPRPLARVTFPLGVALNDLPHVAAALLVASTALTVADGGLSSPAGWAVAALAAATLAGLAVLLARALRAPAAVRAALDQGLGEGWRARAPVQPGGAGRVARALLLPFPFRPRGVERIRDIPYGDAGRRNRLDVYRRRGRPPDGPTLVYFHGGGYFSGGKHREARALLHRLASRGWLCVSANYRLRPAVAFPDHLVDAKRAIAWAHEHAREHGAEGSPLVVAGSSAGGHLAAFAALTPGDPGFQPGFEDADTSVDACVSLYGYLGEYYGQGAGSSPRAHLRADAPPFLLAQGDQDSYSPRFLDIARAFARDLRRTSDGPVVHAELPGAQHAFDVFRSVRCVAVVDGVEAFAARVLGARAPAARR